VIDIKLLRDQPDAVRASQRARGEQKAALVAEAKATSDQVKELQTAADVADTELGALIRRVPNIVIEGIPSGGEDNFEVLETVGTARDFAAEGFEPKDHLEIAEGLDAIDMARGAKVGGSRFYFLKGVGARLELALLNMAVAQAVEAGFTPMTTPTLVKADVMAGAGFLDVHAEEVYHLEVDDLYLTGTSEVALAGYHADEILDLSGGPKRYAGWSACYRREAGSYGKDTRGIIRVHQFQKVEMFSYCRPLRCDTQRHVGHHPLARGDSGEPPAGRRLCGCADRVAALPRPRRPHADGLSAARDGRTAGRPRPRRHDDPP